MKKLILFLFVTFVFTACQKNETEVDPENVAEIVSGTYELTAFRYREGSEVINLPTMPYTQNGQTISGTVELDPTSQDEVTMTLTLKATGQQPQSINIDKLKVEKSGKSHVLTAGGDTVAEVDGKNLAFSLSETAQNGEQLELRFEAEK